MEFSRNVSSIKTEPKDAFTETIKMVEDDFYKLNEIVSQNLRIEQDIEKQLEKEDKKCTFLKHTIERLKKQLEDAEKICTDQRNYIFDLQMEVEQISTTIYEQMEVKRIAYPEEDILPYREMVKVVQRMVDCITNFKTIIQQNIDDCTSRSEETEYWKNASTQLINRISDLKISTDELRLEINQIVDFINGRSLENINKNTECLREIHEEFKNMKASLHETVAEKKKLGLWRQQILDESADKKKSWALTQENYENLKKASVDNMDNLRVEISSNHQYYSFMMNEMRTSMEIIEKEMKKYESFIAEKSAQLEDAITKETVLKCEDENIILNIEKLNHELSKLKESIEVLENQEIFAKNMYDSMQQHINTLKTSISGKEIRLKNFTSELEELTSNLAEFSSIDCDKPDDASRFAGQSDLENVWSQNENLEKEHMKLIQEANDLQTEEKEQKFKLSAECTEIDFLNSLYNKIHDEIYEEKRKAKEEMNDKIEKSIENVNELSNTVAEKNLFLDSVKADVQKYFHLIPQLESEIKVKTKENADKKAKLSEIEETYNCEENNLESKLRLLEDLERNTFPKHKIPPEWLQSLQQKKDEYEKLKAERIELEKKRNSLKKFEKESVEKNNDLKSPKMYNDADSSKSRMDLEMKSAAYKIFKERIMKKSGTPSLG